MGGLDSGIVVGADVSSRHAGFVLIDGRTGKLLAFRHMLANSSDPVEVSWYFVEGLIQLARDVVLDDDLKSFDWDVTVEKPLLQFSGTRWRQRDIIRLVEVNAAFRALVRERFVTNAIPLAANTARSVFKLNSGNQGVKDRVVCFAHEKLNLIHGWMSLPRRAKEDIADAYVLSYAWFIRESKKRSAIYSSTHEVKTNFPKSIVIQHRRQSFHTL
jgi:hypothetical protein